MTWKRPADHEVRQTWKFTLLPMLLGDEVRWMEWVLVRQMYVREYHSDRYHTWISSQGWQDISFVKPILLEIRD